MQQHLTEQLWAHIIVDHPELMNRLKESHSVNSYLEEKVNRIMPYLETLIQEGFANHAITELCVKAMTLELGPSCYRYLRYMLEDEFPDIYERYAKEGIVTHQVIKMVEAFAGSLRGGWL